MASKLLSRYPWITTPLIAGAPMRVMAGPELAVEISRAGGLGFIGPNPKTRDSAADLQEATKLLSNAPTLTTKPTLPVGAGFLLWSDDMKEAVAAVEQYKPCATWLYAPRQFDEFASWSREFRQVSPGTDIWIQIGTVNEARELLALAEKPDVIVVQGAESGGHGRKTDGLGLMSLFPEVADLAAHSGVPLVATGGIADGRGVAAGLSLGASGVVMGTRFLAATEARINKGYQNEVVRVSDAAMNTTRTLLYNHLRGTFGWPKEYSPRTIINQTFVDHQQGVPFDQLKAFHDEAAKKGDAGWGPDGRLATYAGASVGLVNDVKRAGDIVRQIQDDAFKRFGLAKSSIEN